MSTLYFGRWNSLSMAPEKTKSIGEGRRQRWRRINAGKGGDNNRPLLLFAY